MSCVTWGCPNQFGYFVLHLVLATIDLQYALFTAVENLGQGFDGARLSRSGRTKEQENARRSAFRRKLRTMHFDVRDDGLDCGRLPDNLLAEHADKICF